MKREKGERRIRKGVGEKEKGGREKGTAENEAKGRRGKEEEEEGDKE